MKIFNFSCSDQIKKLFKIECFSAFLRFCQTSTLQWILCRKIKKVFNNLNRHVHCILKLIKHASKKLFYNGNQYEASSQQQLSPAQYRKTFLTHLLNLIHTIIKLALTVIVNIGCQIAFFTFSISVLNFKLGACGEKTVPEAKFNLAPLL